MESDLPPSSAPENVKFAPDRSPLRKAKQPETETKSEIVDAGDAEDKDRLTGRNPKIKKSAVQVAFAHGVASSPSVRTNRKPIEGTHERSDRVELANYTSDSREGIVDSPSIGISGDIIASPEKALEFSKKPKKRDYLEPWDHHQSYCPITLPLRRPYSGDPEVLDNAEFGETDTSLEYDENVINSASDLDLLEESSERRMIFIQLPANIPSGRRPPRSDDREADGYGIMESSSISRGTVVPSIRKGSDVNESFSVDSTSRKEKGAGNPMHYPMMGNSSHSLSSSKGFPAGFIGKMLVYKSGAVKLKLGDLLYDVSPGSSCSFAQDVVAINTSEKHCCALGELSNRAVVTPDVDFLLESLMHTK